MLVRPKSSRHAATIVETGFHSAKYWSAFGIPVVGAKALERNVSGKTVRKTSEFATRASRTESPMRTPIHDIAKPKRRRKRNPPMIERIEELGRHPTRNPARPITTRTTTLRAESPRARPTTTAEREIGSDLNRSISPFSISCARPTAVPASVNATVWTKIPGIKSWT